MHVAPTPEQRTFQMQVRSLVESLMTPELRAEIADSDGGGPEYMKAMEHLGREGWLGVGWPVEIGGQGRSPIEEFLFRWRWNLKHPPKNLGEEALTESIPSQG